MADFISRMIEKYAGRSLEEGQELYRKYFVRTKLYAAYKENVDARLTGSGLEAVIVAE